MNMKYYNASNHFSAPIKKEPKPYSPYTRRPEIIIPQKPSYPPQESENPKHDYHTQPLRQPEMPIVPAPQKKETKETEPPFHDLKPDDWLLLGIIALLIWNSCDDTLLLLILGYLFLVGLHK